jgi:DNA-directed RNA polymerase specialized sigma24 family protein
MVSSDGSRAPADPAPADPIAASYGAAVAVCANREVARHVTLVALETASDHEEDPALRTLRLGVRTLPGRPYNRMTLEQREAVALARPGGVTVDEIAAMLGISAAETKRRMLAGLRAAAEAAPKAQSR